jgi:alkaline phosphatase
MPGSVGRLWQEAEALLRPATDSAAAATAMSCGRKTDAGNIAWAPGDPAGGGWETFGAWMRGRGARVGLVTTVPFNHATPAAFAVANIDRGNYSAAERGLGYQGPTLDSQLLLDFRPAVLVGGGHPHWDAGWTTERVLRAVRRQTDAILVERRAGRDGGRALLAAAERAAARGQRLVGLFGGGSDGRLEHPLPLHAPGRPSCERAAEDPHLAAATEAAIAVLTSRPGGWFLMVEGGDIDWAAHDRELGWLIGATAALDRAVCRAVELVDARPQLDWSNTLLIVTADHACGYHRLDPQRRSGAGELDGLEAALRTHIGAHTNELVTLAARGAGAEHFHALERWYGPQPIVDNTQLHRVMRRAVASGTRHLLLFIGDGMHRVHEVATSRYLYGRDHGLRWHAADFNFQGWAATWDVTSYDRLAAIFGAPAYRAGDFDPCLGYDPTLGGERPAVFAAPHRDYFLRPWLLGRTDPLQMRLFSGP